MRYLLFILLMSCAADDPGTHLQRAKNAVDVNEYRESLLKCKAQGKDAGSFSVYERCAREADKKYGLEGDGGFND